MKTMEYLYPLSILWLRVQLARAERLGRKKLWEGAKKEQKELSKQGKLKKLFIREKER